MSHNAPNAFQTTQQGEWQNDATVLTLPKITPQQIGEGPDIGGEIVCFLCHV